MSSDVISFSSSESSTSFEAEKPNCCPFAFFTLSSTTLSRPTKEPPAINKIFLFSVLIQIL